MEALLLRVESGGRVRQVLSVRGEGEVSVVFDQLLEEVGEIFAGLKELVDELEGVREAVFRKGLIESEEELFGNKAERLADDGCCDVVLRQSRGFGRRAIQRRGGSLRQKWR